MKNKDYWWCKNDVLYVFKGCGRGPMIWIGTGSILNLYAFAGYVVCCYAEYEFSYNLTVEILFTVTRKGTQIE